MVDVIGEHCIGLLFHWCHWRLFLSLGILWLGGLEVIPCLMNVDLGCCHGRVRCLLIRLIVKFGHVENYTLLIYFRIVYLNVLNIVVWYQCAISVLVL